SRLCALLLLRDAMLRCASRILAMGLALVCAGIATVAQTAEAADKKPNILVIFGDDIGQTNISAYSHGLMGYQTSNIDRLAREGMMFIDYYAEQSCTAGRSSFITGQATLRTGLSKVGVPGAPVGLQARDATIVELLKPLGYATGQFGKNHLGDKNEYLPTVHGFDEFFGNLYHLNAEEDTEDFNYPKDPKFKELFGPRGVISSEATEKDDQTEQPRWGRIGKQTIEDTGPLTRKRMETIDDETSAAAVNFIERQAKVGKPTTEISLLCDMRIGRLYSWNSACREPWECGRSRLWRFAFPNSLTSAPTPMSGRTSRPTPIGTGLPTKVT